MLRDDQLYTLLLGDDLTQRVLCLLLARAMSTWMDKFQLTTREGPACCLASLNTREPYSDYSLGLVMIESS